ncbi:hypothetical protein CCR75_008371 [Bremia lactucae]|uniref:Ribosomal RNA-processing protein 7 C-terminal domain-containing protein n=1 Tax=Bremia lactucae TaxID=4779 RepID=A0A976FH22_BRELC|nr:hypothetical protein CCR75_008371 [Bremia lactucae]
MSAKGVGGYHAIALPLPHSPFRRFVYVKKHEAKKSDSNVKANADTALAAGYTAYFVNLPANASVQWLRACLGPLGAIQNITLGKTEHSSHKVAEKGAGTNGRTAHVVFQTKNSLDQLLHVDALETPAPSESSGLQAYATTYRQNRPGIVAIKDVADRYMALFEKLETENTRRREEVKNQVQEDGFQTVVNTKKRSSEDVLSRPAKKQKSKELSNFYRFQTREKKRDQLKRLRERFEEDREQVEKMKHANHFCPE